MFGVSLSKWRAVAVEWLDAKIRDPSGHITLHIKLATVRCAEILLEKVHLKEILDLKFIEECYKTEISIKLENLNAKKDLRVAQAVEAFNTADAIKKRMALERVRALGSSEKDKAEAEKIRMEAYALRIKAIADLLKAIAELEKAGGKFVLDSQSLTALLETRASIEKKLEGD